MTTTNRLPRRSTNDIRPSSNAGVPAIPFYEPGTQRGPSLVDSKLLYTYVILYSIHVPSTPTRFGHTQPGWALRHRPQPDWSRAWPETMSPPRTWTARRKGPPLSFPARLGTPG